MRFSVPDFCSQAIEMGIPKGPSEGGSGGNRGHSNMEHWGFTDEVKEAARKRRRLDDKRVIDEEMKEADEPDHRSEASNSP